jgi:hypothetical protein
MTTAEILANYPDLERADLPAALEFGALAAGRRRTAPCEGPRRQEADHVELGPRALIVHRRRDETRG